MAENNSVENKEVGEAPAQEIKKSTELTAVEEEETTIEADLASGAKNFALKNYGEAAESFSKACEKLSKRFGRENHPGLVDAQISYGKALLNNAIRLGSVLGQQPGNQNPKNDKADEFDEAQEKSNGKEKSGSAVAGSSKAQSSAANSKPTAGNPRIHFSGDSSDEEEGGEEGEDGVDEEEDGMNEACSVEEELENAFQVLEIARLTIKSQIDSLSSEADKKNDGDDQIKKLRLKICTVYDLLAEVHQESEQFELAVESYINSLEVKESSPAGLFSPRSLAENHLMIALAFELSPSDSSSLNKSIEHVDKAISLMKGYLEDLEAKLKKAEGENDLKESDVKSDKNSNFSSEVEEVESLITELEAKRDELKTVPQPPTPTEKEKALQEYFASVTTPGKSIDRGIVNDLSMLVKKKRVRSSEEESSKQSDTKAKGGSEAVTKDDYGEVEAKKPKIDQ